jgi:GNAT superfamily N-acetyltransferase
VTAYRFCRTDDIGLLVDALNHCWAPHFPDEPLMTPAAFKRSIRDLQVWCSSCMVAFSGSDPIGVLIGAKRPAATLVWKIAVHPDHRRQGHGRHLLASLGSKLAILGPPRIVAEVPDTLTRACGLFEACGYEQEAPLTDYVLDEIDVSEAEHNRRFLIPVTVDDLGANGLLDSFPPQTCWERSVETLKAGKDAIAGLAVASEEQIEACVLYRARDPGASGAGGAETNTDSAEIVALRSFVEDAGDRLRLLLARLTAQGLEALRFVKVHPSEISSGCLATLGFRPTGGHMLYAATARAD